MKLKLKPTSQLILDLGLEPNGEIHQWFTDTCALHMDKYVPYRHGDLARSVVLPSGEINRGNVFENAIVYNQEYASYVYYGMRRDGSHVIKNYTTDVHEQAGPYWDERMWSAEKQEVVKEVQNYFNKRGRK